MEGHRKMVEHMCDLLTDLLGVEVSVWQARENTSMLMGRSLVVQRMTGQEPLMSTAFIRMMKQSITGQGKGRMAVGMCIGMGNTFPLLESAPQKKLRSILWRWTTKLDSTELAEFGKGV